jgi:hypothetical protein
MKTNKERIPEAMASRQRIVSQLPLDHLFNAEGSLDYVRGESLTSAAVESVLQGSRECCLVEAKIGEPLHWQARGDYGFWYRGAREHTAEPDQRMPLGDFADARCYFVSEWLEPSSGNRVLLFEEYH